MDQQILVDNHPVTHINDNGNIDMDIVNSDSDSSDSDVDPFVQLLCNQGAVFWG